MEISAVFIKLEIDVCKFFQFGSVYLKSLPKGKILDWTKWKAFADNKIILVKMVISVTERIENIIGKSENASCQHSFSHNVF